MSAAGAHTAKDLDASITTATNYSFFRVIESTVGIKTFCFDL